MDLVDQPGAQKLLNGRNCLLRRESFPFAAAEARSAAAWMPSVTKWNVVPSTEIPKALTLT